MDLYTVSELKQFADCPKKYSHRYEAKIVPIKTLCDSADVGTAIHKGIRFLYDTGGDVEGARKVAHDHIDPLQPTCEDTYVVGRAIRNFDAQIRIPESAEVVATEKVVWFTLPTLPNICDPAPFILAGQIDLIVRDRDGSLRLIDHKTAFKSASPSAYHTAFQLNWQPHVYAYLWNLNHPSDPIKNVSFNLIRKTKEVDITTFHCTVTSSTIYEALNYNVFPLVDAMRQLYRPRNPSACTRFNKICEYANLCLGLPYFPSEWTAPEDRYADELREKVRDGALPPRSNLA